MQVVKRRWAGWMFAGASVLLSACASIELAPDLSSEKGAAAYARASAERLGDPKLHAEDPQELAMRLHYLAVLARNHPRAWSPEDRAAVVQATVPLLTYTWVAPTSSSLFASRPALLNDSANDTALRVRMLALDLATALPSPVFVPALARAVERLAAADCPRYLKAVEANATALDAAGARQAFAEGVLRVRSAVAARDAAGLNCVAALEAQVLREQELAALWSAEPERRAATSLAALQAATRGALGRALASPQPSKAGVQALESALRARARLPQAGALLQAYFPWSYLHAVPLPDPASSEVHASLSAHLATRAWVNQLQARLPAAPGSAPAWVEAPGGGRVFNPHWVAANGGVPTLPEVPAAFWARYEAAPGADENVWLANLYRAGRWEAIRRHMAERPVSTSTRWLAAWGAALSTQDGPLLGKASLALATVPEPAARAEGLSLMSSLFRRPPSPGAPAGACPAPLLRGLGDALSGATQPDDRGAVLQALDLCLRRAEYEPAHKAVLGGLSRLDGTDGSFRGFVNGRPLTWLLDACRDGALQLGRIEAALRLRVDEYLALGPAAQQHAQQVLATLAASSDTLQSLPARRLQTVFKQAAPAAEQPGKVAR